ncbi:hypothetical protein OS128_05295 [Corynebacterium sp. P5848]|uniref:hypothetical protein n=1 Tax=Corynebacterium marambiense TaxID=2765364 RepID=UPI0022609A27|nr:hypothetical protein [Corynebacterium marambiense]MCX7542326.1 hypothetical protein [Corynebacterium marambiense]
MPWIRLNGSHFDEPEEELSKHLKDSERNIKKLEDMSAAAVKKTGRVNPMLEADLAEARTNHELISDLLSSDFKTTLDGIRQSRDAERILRARMNLADVQKRVAGDTSRDARALIEDARREVELAALPEDEAISRRDSGARIGSIKRPGGEVRWSFLPEEKLITLDFDDSVSPSLESLSEVENAIPFAVGKCLGEIWPGLEVKLKARLTAVLYPNPFVIKDQQERPVTVLLFSLQKHRFEESSWDQIDRVLAVFHK